MAGSKRRRPRPTDRHAPSTGRGRGQYRPIVGAMEPQAQEQKPFDLSASGSPVASTTISSSTTAYTPKSISDSSVSEMSAAQYLSEVSRQARSLPRVFTSKPKDGGKKHNIDKERNVEDAGGTAGYISVLFKKSSLVRHNLPEIPEEGRGRVDRIWVEECVLPSFRRSREYLQECRIKIEKNRTVAVPPLKDRDGWMDFCLGQEHYWTLMEDEKEEEMEEPYYEMSDDDDDGVDDDEPEWQRTCPSGGRPPHVRLLLQFDQVCVRRVLSHFAASLEEYSVDENCVNDVSGNPCNDLDAAVLTGKAGAWIYALLGALEMPLHREEGWMMRRLLRACCQIRRKLVLSISEEDPRLTSYINKNVGWEEMNEKGWGIDEHLGLLNTIIVVLVQFFSQGPESLIGWIDSGAKLNEKEKLILNHVHTNK